MPNRAEFAAPHHQAGKGHCGGGVGTRPCRAFPGEVEDFYCLACHVPCSALSLLVGDHTNHPRSRLDDAYETAPTDIAREASELQHCVDVFAATVAHRLHQQQQLEAEMQKQLNATKANIARMLEEQAYLEHHMAACGAAFEEDCLVDRSRMQELRRAGQNLRRATEEWKRMYEEDVRHHEMSPMACQTTCKELDDVRNRLSRVLKSLEGFLEYFSGSRKTAPTCDATPGLTGSRLGGGGLAAPPPHGATAHCHHHHHHHPFATPPPPPPPQRVFGVEGVAEASEAATVGVRRSAQDRAALYQSQCQNQALQPPHQQPLGGTRAATATDPFYSVDAERPATLSAAALLGDLESTLLARRCALERRDTTTSPLDSRASMESEHLVDDTPPDVRAAPSQRKRDEAVLKTRHSRRQPASPSSSSESGGDNTHAACARTPTAASPSVHRRATLLRQYYHLRSCLQDAIDTNQPAALVRMFVRGIRQLRAEAQLAGCDKDIERAVAGDAASSAEYALIFEGA